MNPMIAELRREHHDIARVLNVVESTLAQVRGAEVVDYGRLCGAVYYLTEYPDLFHHVKEDLLYRHLRRRRRSARELVDDITAEHEHLRQLGLAFLELAEDAAEELLVSRDTLTRCGLDYVRTEREHMRREEEKVFPLLEEALHEQDWVEIQRTLSADGVLGLRPATRERFAAVRAEIGE